MQEFKKWGLCFWQQSFNKEGFEFRHFFWWYVIPPDQKQDSSFLVFDFSSLKF